jgi:hypothetical protein
VRLDHLLSKERLRLAGPSQVLVVRFAGEPIAQAFVLRWVLEGGISTDRWSFGGFHASTVSFRGCLERVGVVRGVVVWHTVGS